MKNSNKGRKYLPLWATLLIPLSPSSQWKNYQFNNIKPNSVTFSKAALRIQVNQSASPLLYSLSETEVESIKVKAKVNETLKPLPKTAIQGEKGFDDFILRFGLIVKGDERLSWLQRRIAPNWLIEMEKQLPSDVGIKKVLFFTTCRQKAQLNKQRSHFLSSVLQETCVTLVESKGPFVIDVVLPAAENVVGLWLASDGDDLANRFTLEIEEILLNYNKKSL